MIEPLTLYRKLVNSHTVKCLDPGGGEVLLYIDRTVLNEYTSPQAFSGLREAGRSVWSPSAATGIVDHVNSTDRMRDIDLRHGSLDIQTRYFAKNCADFGIELLDILHPLQGIEHVVMPELGLVLPGQVIAAGDSHTTTYGALGALGFGIGTSDIEHYLATQTVPYRVLRDMRVYVDGDLALGLTAKDIVMALIARIGAGGATGFAVEFAGPAIHSLSVEGRMTVCNMAVECGARAALIAADDKVFAYLRGRPRAPHGAYWDAALRDWAGLTSDPGANFEREVHLDAGTLEPYVSWGTSPDQAAPIGQVVPNPVDEPDRRRRIDLERALDYMGLTPGMSLSGISIGRAFIGSCTNARIEDLRDAAAVVAGHHVASGVRAMVVPGSTSVRRQAEAEGLDLIFMQAGFEWRQSGCSMCLAMNDDVLAPGERCASSTNRNFEGRQGRGGRTHLMSPAMVAAAAISGHLTDVREFMKGA